MSVVIAWAFVIMATLLAILIGGFRLALLSLGEPARCAPGYLNPKPRFLMYHLPLGLLTLGAVFLMPNWGLSVIAAIAVAVAFQYGARRMRRAAVQRMAAYLRETERLDQSAATREAERTISAVVDARRLGVR